MTIIKIASIVIGAAVVVAIGLFLWGCWILNHEEPTDMWKGK
jgi:hypothetical protein